MGTPPHMAQGAGPVGLLAEGFPRLWMGRIPSPQAAGHGPLILHLAQLCFSTTPGSPASTHQTRDPSQPFPRAPCCGSSIILHDWHLPSRVSHRPPVRALRVFSLPESPSSSNQNVPHVSQSTPDMRCQNHSLACTLVDQTGGPMRAEMTVCPPSPARPVPTCSRFKKRPKSPCPGPVPLLCYCYLSLGVSWQRLMSGTEVTPQRLYCPSPMERDTSSTPRTRPSLRGGKHKDSI